MANDLDIQSLSKALEDWDSDDDYFDESEIQASNRILRESGTSTLTILDCPCSWYRKGIWLKRKIKNEAKTYQLVSPHPRILPVIGVDLYEGYMVFKYQRNGDLWRFLARNISTPSNVPLTTRIVWAIDIAQGLAHLHDKKVVWADAHLANILLNDEYHAILCDFGFAVRNPKFFHMFNTTPPTIFFCPPNYFDNQPTHVDIFGFAVILFVLLDYRFPFTENVTPNQETQNSTADKHCSRQFDTLRDPILHKYFGKILDDCFRVRILTGDVLVQRLLEAHGQWFSETGQVCRIASHSHSILLIWFRCIIGHK
jgi:serine/threonine protein kinase